MWVVARQFLDGLLGREPAESLRQHIDWPRFRLLQLMQGTAGTDVATRERLLARGLLELERGRFDVETEERALQALRSLFAQLLPQGWRFCEEGENPLLAALRAGPAATTPPQLRRYLTLLQEVACAASAVTVIGREPGPRLVTLLFVEERYVGFLPGPRTEE